MSSPIEYRGFVIEPNFRSIHGTGARLKTARGWNVRLQGYGYIGWFSNLSDAKQHADGLHAGDCNDRIRKLLTGLNNVGHN